MNGVRDFFVYFSNLNGDSVFWELRAGRFLDRTLADDCDCLGDGICDAVEDLRYELVRLAFIANKMNTD